MKEYTTYIQRGVELSSPELAMLEKVTKKQSVEIQYIPFHNNDLLFERLDNIENILVALQPKSPLHSVVYPISEVNASTLSNLLIRLKRKK